MAVVGRVYKARPSNMETAVNRKSFSEIISADPLVLVDFYTEWCGPCKMMKPILEEVKSAVGNTVRIIKIDVERNIRIASQYQVMGVPTLVLFKDGKPVWRQSGVVPATVLKKVVEANG